jgi:hypothetical protein
MLLIKKMSLLVAIGLLASATTQANTLPKPFKAVYEVQAEELSKNVDAIDEEVLALALRAYDSARDKGVVKQSKLTVIDYSLPSSKPRMWVFDLENKKLIHELLVTHGAKTGLLDSTQFSNQHESHKTSIGVFVTQETYNGKNGYSLRLNGLEKGFNDNARSRAIVIHGANYAKPEYLESTGRLGRSWGCPAVDPRVNKALINNIKGGSVVFAYYPDKKWLQSSAYL